MKKTFSLIIGIVISTNVWADQPSLPAATNLPAPPYTEPSKPAPKKKPAPRARRAAAQLRTVPLVAGPAVVAVSPLSRLNVRAQPRLKSEIIAHMTNGEPVTVIEEIRLDVSLPDEPSVWAKIVLPDKAHPWVYAPYVDQTNLTVKVKKLNLRGGPGENYSILGSLQAGDTVKEVSRKGDWMEVETATTAYAYMAAQYLKQEAAVAPIVSTEPPPTTSTTVTEPVLATTTTEMAVETPTITTEVAMGGTSENAAATAVIEEPPPPRIVQREGIVRGTFSIQAPTKYELISEENRRPINYLYTPSPDLDLSRYKGLHIIVSGEEGLDERWKNTPVLTIQSIHVVD